MSKKDILIQTALMPAYYKDFHCIMGACQDNCCCSDWEIVFDKKDYLKFKRSAKSGELEALTAQGIERLREKAYGDKYAHIKMNDRQECPFHGADGLCALQKECGEEVLPRVCRTYPRSRRYTAAALEYGLGVSCEGVLSLLWNLPEGIDFIEEPLKKKDCKMYEASSEAAARFPEIRALCIDVLQERSLRLPKRLMLLGLLFQKLRELDWEDGAAIDRWLAWGETLLHAPGTAALLNQMPADRETYLNYNFNLFRNMKGELGQELNHAMADIHKDAKLGLVGGFDGPRYQEMENRLEELLGHSEYFFENMLVAINFGNGFPALASPDSLWENYVSLCTIYSVCRCAAVCACGSETSRERLFHVLVYVSRQTIHNAKFILKMKRDCYEQDNASLAYLAILVSG